MDEYTYDGFFFLDASTDELHLKIKFPGRALEETSFSLEGVKEAGSYDDIENILYMTDAIVVHWNTHLLEMYKIDRNDYSVYLVDGASE